ncbi:MAG: hypothetical protein FK730_11890 [Asgard group archaeon]|nr:hypothetical protein [Asgard group archaeon]
MGIVGAFILPHGSMVLDYKKAKKHGAEGLHKAMTTMAKQIKELKPDLIFLTSPHGISNSNDFGIYLNKIAKCSAEWNGDYKEFTCEVSLDQELSEKLLDYLTEKETAISGIASYTPSMEIPLRWGEAVPLWFLKDISAKYVIMSQPLKRLEMAKDMIPETLTLGNDLRLFFEKLRRRVVVIISADLAHTHLKDGPYGFNEAASIFDDLIGNWAGSLDENILLKKVIPKLDKAKVCGYVGFVILQGMIGKMKFKPALHINEAPTYYGMMVANYTKSI